MPGRSLCAAWWFIARDEDSQSGFNMSNIERGSTNVYADLGLDNADEMLVKAQLATKIGDILKRRKLTQMQAAELLGIPQPKLSGLLRGQFRGISESKMLECLTRLGRDVEIVVKSAPRSRAEGHVSVVFI